MNRRQFILAACVAAAANHFGDSTLWEGIRIPKPLAMGSGWKELSVYYNRSALEQFRKQFAFGELGHGLAPIRQGRAIKWFRYE